MSIQELLNRENYSRREILELLEISGKDNLEKLYNRANEVRVKYRGDKVNLGGVIEISNYCSQNCLFCPFREDNFSIARYRMTADEIINAAKELRSRGIGNIILKSGEDSFFDIDLVAYLIYSIKKELDISVILALGERGFDEYRTWKIAGADGYFLNHLSSNSKKYQLMRAGRRLEEHIHHLTYLKKLGYIVGTGNILGLPEQSLEDVADDILLMKKVDTDIAITTPFIPALFTPFQNRDRGEMELLLKTISVMRLVMNDKLIPAVAHLDSLEKEGRIKGLKAGANVVIASFTPEEYKEYCHKYPREACSDVSPVENCKMLANKLEKAGFDISR